MHCLVVWRSKQPAFRDEKILLELISAFSGRQFARALDDIFVVGVDSTKDRRALVDRLEEVATANNGKFNLIVSPPSEGGYGGWLPKSAWTDIRRITKHEVSDV